MNLGNLPPVCLFDTISMLPPDKISSLSYVNNDMSKTCTSQALWKDIYIHQFPPTTFQLHQPNHTTNWISIFSKRYSIINNIRTHKPKVKSFVQKDIIKVRSLMNAFAYNTSSSIFLNAYEYQENECKYEELYHIPIENQDFVFLDSQSILSVGVNNLAIIDLQTQKNTFYNIETGSHPHIQPISSDLFAIINKGKCCVYDIREGCDTRCEFYHNSNILETSHEGSTIFIAGSEDISAHDVRNPRGPVLWSYSTNKEIPFCSFNIKEKFALCGNHIINLMNGKCVSKSDVYNPVCGSIYDNKIAIIGSERRSLLFYNYQKHEEVATFMFTEHEGIKSIDSSSMNGYVAVAADYNVKILKAPTENEPNVSEVRNVLCGSIAQRKRGEIGPVKQVVFDGERLITNMGSFVRVYDFYTGKAFVKK